MAYRIEKYGTPFRCVAEFTHCQTADFTEEMGVETARRRDQFAHLVLQVTREYADAGGKENKYLEMAVHYMELAKLMLNTGYVASVGKVGEHTVDEAVSMSTAK